MLSFIDFILDFGSDIVAQFPRTRWCERKHLDEQREHADYLGKRKCLLLEFRAHFYGKNHVQFALSRTTAASLCAWMRSRTVDAQPSSTTYTQSVWAVKRKIRFRDNNNWHQKYAQFPQIKPTIVANNRIIGNHFFGYPGNICARLLNCR